ncbi:MAG: helix-turn-helix transcriptional regulator [Clostridia bacterium]|nr:helix-turn-helix transcriptional regulator [Clostridia bacterium]
MNEIKDIIAQNLTKLRQSRNLTQSELAETLNYSDKSISKWEHGDATPPIEVLKRIADLYDVSLDFLVTENPNTVYDKKYGRKGNNQNKIIITLLAVSLVWLTSVILYVYGSLLAGQNYWILFVLSVPVSSIVLIVFNSIWGKVKHTFILVSILVWSTLATIYLHFISYNPWMIFFIGVPLQIGIILWSQLKSSKTKK